MIFTTNDPLGREIRLPTNSWFHTQKHLEFFTWDSVKITIEKPNVIQPSTRKSGRDVYYRLGALETYPPLYVAVVVGFKGNNGDIITAHLSGDIDKPGPGGYKYVSFEK